jgi:hypothetical protein
MWDVENNSTFFLYHPVKRLFVGQPVKPPLHAPTSRSDSLSLPMVSDLNLLQPLQLQNFRLNENSKLITVNTVFTLLVTVDQQKIYKIHTPIFSVHHIAEGPPASVDLLPLTAVDKTPQRVEPQTSWVFRPASARQMAKNDTVLHFGMPVHIMKANGRRYLRMDLDDRFLAVHSSPVQESEMDTWVLYPTSAVSICLNPQSQFCHYVEGQQIGKLLFECKYLSSPAHNDHQLTCMTKEKHPVFPSETECHKKCQWPSFECSGPPLFQCTTQTMSKPGAVWQDFDTCTLNCVALHSDQKSAKPTSKPVGADTPQVDVGVWLLWAFLALFIISAIILGIRAIQRSSPSIEKTSP